MTRFPTFPSAPPDPTHVLALARQVLATEAHAIGVLAARLDSTFANAVVRILDCRGRVIVTGMGKSGHIARKIAATLASTGTPSFFVHPSEASHGDLGMITPLDVVLALSNSGETDEVVALIPHLKREGSGLIAMTGNAGSTLARAADVHLDASVESEACPLGLAPTTSTTVALALGDALALALLDARGFSAEDFARSHPGGTLGRRLLTRVSDIMRTGDALPMVAQTATLQDALVVISGKGMGMTAVLDDDARVVGIFTDGDLRRYLEKNRDLAVPIRQLMKTAPRTIHADQLAVDAVTLMEAAPKISQLLVVDDAQHLIGALHVHDLFRARIL
ncbi:MAG: KpsF/GutQ family sugar-phosphate isomerase [Proteobacteria bacterium]|nr:KpsF/GutQ family sugar-phosphate isomerase [Pseudomonadota bacterium]MCL2306817.1 KpsF/GutQ family sugar-phosphate isomerase [Pseudomonadota bacterium]